jgi:hypothetical protein
MSYSCPTVKVKSWGENQGDFVDVNQSEYDADPSKFELFIPPLMPPPGPPVPPPPAVPPSPLDALKEDWRDGDVAELKAIAAAITGRAVENKDQAVAVIEAALAAK